MLSWLHNLTPCKVHRYSKKRNLCEVAGKLIAAKSGLWLASKNKIKYFCLCLEFTKIRTNKWIINLP